MWSPLHTHHGNTPDGVLTQVLSDLEHQPTTFWLNLAISELDVQSVQDGREVVRVKVNIDDGSDDGLDGTSKSGGRGGVVADGSSVDCGR